MKITLENMYVSEYEDFILYTTGFTRKSKAYAYDKRDNTLWGVGLIKVEKTMANSNLKLIETFCDVVVTDYEGEFVTDDAIYYVVTKLNSNGQELDGPPEVINPKGYC